MAFNFKYLTKDILHGFDKYKYNAIDTSPVSKYVTHPFWNWIVQFCPKWIAPNILTLAGFLLLVLEFILFTYYDCHFYASDDTHPEYSPMPGWIFLVAANCMFWAHTLDGIDGKQARRTGCTGPLGELFDHGLDSWATFFMPIGMYNVFGRGDFSVPPWRFHYIIVAVMVTFMFSHWEKYNTGVLYLPWGYDISQMGMALVYLITYFGGYKIWKFTLPFLGWEVADILEIGMHCGVIFLSLGVSLYNVYVSYRDKTGRMNSLYEANRPLIALVVLFGLIELWAQFSSYDIVRKQPRLFWFAMGAVFSNIQCRLIVNCMSKTRCEVFNWLILPLLAIVLGVLTLPLGVIELYLLWAYAIFTFAAHVHYGCCVVQQLSDHLNIYVFSTKKPPPKTQ